MHVAEFMDLRTFVNSVGLDRASNDFFFQTECFLLVMLPFSFVMPAVWQAARTEADRGAPLHRQTLFWIVAFGLAAASIAACIPGFAGSGDTRLIAQLGRLAPWGIAATGFGGAFFLLLARSSAASALLAASGGVALTAWILWLRGHLCGREPPIYLAAIVIILGLAATILILGRRQRAPVPFDRFRRVRLPRTRRHPKRKPVRARGRFRDGLEFRRLGF